MDEQQPILVCHSLKKSYGQKEALHDVSLDVPAGKIIGLLGPNGSGKTTFMKICAGLLTKSGGDVTVLGYPIGEKTKAAVAYLPERNSIPEYMTVGEALSFYQDFFADFDRPRAEAMLQRLGVEASYLIRSLSKGTKEKVQLVMVMARRAKLYLLDEPISGVDPAAREFIIDTVLGNFDPASSVLISTHLITDIQDKLDGFIMMKDGRVQALGTPKGLLEKTGKTLDEYFREVFRC